MKGAMSAPVCTENLIRVCDKYGLRKTQGRGSLKIRPVFDDTMPSPG
jgi:hypothetical protein